MWTKTSQEPMLDSGCLRGRKHRGRVLVSCPKEKQHEGNFVYFICFFTTLEAIFPRFDPCRSPYRVVSPAGNALWVLYCT